jgi:release factor glutamine methyltransferase
LRDSGSPSARLDSEVLLGHILNISRTQLFCRSFEVLGSAQVEAFFGLISQRSQGAPVAYLVGHKEFYSREFQVTPSVLIPRPDTETLVDEAIRLVERSGLARPRILELGTGSGCLAITLALEIDGSLVRATDISLEAIQIAEENSRRLGSERQIKWFCSDLFDDLVDLKLKPGFDLIVSNPPYVATDCGPRPDDAVVRYEPGLALWAGRDGLDLIRRLVDQAPYWLNPGGSIAIEMASFQVEGVEALMQQRGFAATSIIADTAGLPRVVVGRWEN